MKYRQDKGMKGALIGLRRAERELLEHLESLRRVIRSIESAGTDSGTRSGEKRNLSEKGRAAIARAAKKRWAEYRAAKARKQT